VAEAARVLAPGGTILLSVPYWNGVGSPRLARLAGGEFAIGGEF
jgi:hypothetical protein